MSKFRTIALGFLAFFFFIFLMVTCVPKSEASEICNGEDNCNEPVSIGGSKALALGMGDVEIGDCLYSWQAVLAQGVRPNLVCLADRMEKIGKYAIAAKLRCDIDAIRKHFESDAECEVALYYEPPERQAD